MTPMICFLITTHSGENLHTQDPRPSHTHTHTPYFTLVNSEFMRPKFPNRRISESKISLVCPSFGVVVVLGSGISACVIVLFVVMCLI